MTSALELSTDLPIDGTKLNMGQTLDKLELSQVSYQIQSPQYLVKPYRKEKREN